MKTIAILFSCMMFTVIALGQNQKPNVGEVKVTAPKFAGIENVADILNRGNRKLLMNTLSKISVIPAKTT